MKRFSVVAFMAIMLLAGAAYAQEEEEEEEVYSLFKVGAFFPNDEEKGLKGYDTGYNAEVAAGYRFNKNLAGELGIGYYSARSWSGGYPKISAIPILATIKGVLPLGKAELYLGAGPGYYFAKYYYTSSSDTSASAGVLGYHVTGGVDYNLSKKLALGLEVKWFSVKADFGELGPVLGYTEVEFGGIITNLSLKYRFEPLED